MEAFGEVGGEGREEGEFSKFQLYDRYEIFIENGSFYIFGYIL